MYATKALNFHQPDSRRRKINALQDLLKTWEKIQNSFSGRSLASWYL